MHLEQPRAGERRRRFLLSGSVPATEVPSESAAIRVKTKMFFMVFFFVPLVAFVPSVLKAVGALHCISKARE